MVYVVKFLDPNCKKLAAVSIFPGMVVMPLLDGVGGGILVDGFIFIYSLFCVNMVGRKGGGRKERGGKGG